MKSILALSLAILLTACSSNDQPESKSAIVANNNRATSQTEEIVKPPVKNEANEVEAEEPVEASDETADEAEESSDLAKALGHKPEYSTFEIVGRDPNTTDIIKINSDGTFTGRMETTETDINTREVSGYAAEYSGKFALGDEIEDKVYELKLVELNLISTAGETTEIRDGLTAEYLDLIPNLDMESSYRLILRGYPSSELTGYLEFFETGTESRGISDIIRLKSNIIIGEERYPFFAEIIDYDNVGEDFDVFARYKGMTLDSAFYPSPQLMTSIEFDNDGYFTGEYFATKQGDDYDAGLEEVAKTYGVNEIHRADFRGKFDLISDNGDGTYDLKVAELEITSEAGANPDLPFEAYVDFIRQREVGDEILLIEAGTHIPKEARAGTSLEEYLHPPTAYPSGHDHITEDESYGLTLYNKTQDIVFTDWTIG